MKSKRTKAIDISATVKKRVWARDNGRCVVCGSNTNVMPNAHYVPRSKGGLGIEENVVTLCTDFTENRCHSRYDFGTLVEREEIKEKIKSYLMSKYGDWDEAALVYRKR